MSAARKSYTTGQAKRSAMADGSPSLQGGHAVLVVNRLAVATDQVQLERRPRQDQFQGVGEEPAQAEVEAGESGEVVEPVRGERGAEIGRQRHRLEPDQLEAERRPRGDPAKRDVEAVHRRAGHQPGDVAHRERPDVAQPDHGVRYSAGAIAGASPGRDRGSASPIASAATLHPIIVQNTPSKDPVAP